MAAAAMAPIRQMEERVLPLRPRRLGTHSRKERQSSRERLGAVGASRARGASAPSLDKDNHLATTVNLTCAEWLKAIETPRDIRREKLAVKRQLMDSLHKLMFDQSLSFAERGQWQRQWERVHNCQSEWIGYKAACCLGASPRVAVPIGCNHRLCPLCAWHRASNGRERIKAMFSRLNHPYLLTLTVPNLATIRKHDFTTFRQHVRAFIKRHSGWIKGGVYSIETTYNRREKTWHIHAHVLMDVESPLPSKEDYVQFHGKRVRHFTLLKRRLEFAWVQSWDRRWRERKRTNAIDLERTDTLFDRWYDLGEANGTREFSHMENGRAVYRVKDLTETELARRTAWNAANRRHVDVRPVHDREGAAFEVLKYITKCAAFVDDPAAVAAFATAVKGARLIQTFGSFYGFTIEDDVNEIKPDWSKLTCACGVNHWVRCGVFFRHEVEMDTEGRWFVKDGAVLLSPGHRRRGQLVDVPIQTESDGGQQKWSIRQSR